MFKKSAVDLNSAFYSQSTVCILHSVCTLPLVGSLPFTLTAVYSSSVKQSLPSVNHEQFPMQMTHKHNKWLQILAQEDFPPKLLWSENADFKFSVNNEGEDVNKKPRSGRNIAQHSENNADKRQRNRRLKSEAL